MTDKLDTAAIRDVRKYKLVHRYDYQSQMLVRPDGSWVKHDDYLALCDALDELRADNERLKRLLDLHGVGPAERYWEGRWRAEAADNERLRAALQPFSEEAGYWISHNYSREDRPVEGFKGYTSVMTCGDLFNAHAALAQKGGEA